ncbi:MAG: hypothetical protein JW755_13380 [Candidatus Aminicenantes bacterium]|nr:hypothetical protein [Candidatus Aminicenantes bacterium]
MTNEAQWFVDIESGYVFNGYNDVQIPGDTGTRFSLTDDLEAESSIFYRLRVGIRFNERHTLSALFAPLSIEASGKLNIPVIFFEEEFSAGVPLDGRYTFNSYRLTYRYTLKNSEKWRIGLGFTAKIRDAAVKLAGEGKTSEKTNVGFVPLLNFLLEYAISDKTSILLEGDALASPGGQGRAEDVLLALQYRLNDKLQIRAGYRILEGGANVEEVYNFALLHFITLGLKFTF